MSAERNPILLDQYKGKSNLQILFQKFGYSEDDLRFYQEGLEQANRALDGNQLSENEGLGSNNIYAIRFGEKREGGEWINKPAIILFVAQKAPLEMVELIYQAPQIGRRFFDNKFPTDVFELHVIPPLSGGTQV